VDEYSEFRDGIYAIHRKFMSQKEGKEVLHHYSCYIMKCMKMRIQV